MEHINLGALPFNGKCTKIAFYHPEKPRQIDPETGYILINPDKLNAPQLKYFTPDRKKKFVEFAKDLFPDMSTVCEMVGVSYATFKLHCELDKKFNEDLDIIRTRKVDKVERSIFEFSQRPQNFMDRIAVMRAYRGDLYNPKTTVTHIKGISEEEAKKRVLNLENVIDVEIIRTSSEIMDGDAVKNLRVPEPLAIKTEPETQSPEILAEPAANSPRPRDPLLDL